MNNKEKVNTNKKNINQFRMQKQKRSGISNKKNVSQSKQKFENKSLWVEQNFKELYPEEPTIHTSTTFFTVGLNYRGNLIKVKVPTGINNHCLPYIFHKEIYKFLLNIKDNNPLLKTAQVVGFETVDYNLLLDYQISIGKGVLTEKTTFNCLEYASSGRLKNYKIYKCLAIGGFSKVYLVRSLKDGNFYAMKVMLKKFISSAQKQNIIVNEKTISSQLNHPFIVKLNHAFETNNFVCFILDCKYLNNVDCPGGELFYHLKQVKRMSQGHARFYFIQILYGLLYLHQQKIIYRDLKPENLLINYDGHIKIADFGLSKQNMKEKQLTYSFCGSTEYMPPEMILREGHSFGVDFYTLGALLYQLVTGLPPFYSKNEQQIKQLILSEELTFPQHIPLSNEIKSLLSGLLHKNQKMRIGSIRGLKQILFHPWVGRINAESILSKQLQPPYIPDINQFNFDENELGDDEEQFTQALLNEHFIDQKKESLVYKDFQFLNLKSLRPQVTTIYDKYGECRKKTSQNINDDKSDIASETRKKKLFKKCNSLKNMNNRNTSDEFFKEKLKRQASSPYLRSASLNTSTNLKRNKTFVNNNTYKEKLVKDGRKKSKQSLSRSSSKKKLNQKYKYQFMEKTIENLNCSKNLKKKSTKLNKENQADGRLMAQQSIHRLMNNSGVMNGSSFLKKKKLMYSYLQN